MERRISVSILNTETRSGGFFSRSYTLYKVIVQIDFTNDFVSFKRFSEIYSFAESLRPRANKNQISLPPFPEKTLINGPKVVALRKEMIQNWFNAVSNVSVFDRKICNFFSIDKNILQKKRNFFNIDDYYVLEFLSKIQVDSNNKLNIFKTFSETFLARRRNLHKDSIKRLLLSLFPLVSEEIIGGYALDFITKITTRERFYEYEKVRSEISGLEIQNFQQLGLEQFLTLKKFSHGELQAYNLLSLIINSNAKEAHKENLVQNSFLIEVLNFNQEAVDRYLNWDCFDFTDRDLRNSKSLNSWLTLKKTENFGISYKYFNKQLELDIEISVHSSIYKLIDLFLVPSERKKWDLKLENFEVAGESCFLFSFDTGKKTLIASTKMQLSESLGSSRIVFCSEETKDFYSEIELENKLHATKTSEKFSMGSENTTAASEKLQSSFNEFDRFKVSWRIILANEFANLYKSDIIEESNALLKSITKFIDITEEKDLNDDPFDKVLLSQACSKKFLRRSIQL